MALKFVICWIPRRSCEFLWRAPQHDDVPAAGDRHAQRDFLGNEMKKTFWREIGVLACLTIIVSVVVFQIKNPPEPSYQGRSVSEWAKDLCFNPSFIDENLQQKHEQAVKAIQQIGVAAVPVALRLCQTTDPWIKKKLLWDLPDALHVDTDNWNISWESDKQAMGANIIQALGSVAEPAIPDLIKLFQP